ncbi:glycosyltransferase family 9 protein [Thermosulfurimonas marina]|uniref:Glycosyltransferase family 9 protein n=1 Tax=Thermosulfurimonas marina TaxID=2047767 RepID=A0A6H1WRG7_9BACT|nr:glycosyltransferase family 9 protein [Thermosulfurimonas marina]QJA05783.1 glycosyltransferase family 9 protein [Thermosulfurimonas marina]
MIALWHEGALGDLLLSRLAIAFLARKEPAILFARSEARVLYQKAGLVTQSFSTETPFRKIQPQRVYFFSRTEAPRAYLERLFFGTDLLRVPTLPQTRHHLALFQLAAAGGSLEEVRGALLLRPSDFRPRPAYLLVHPGSGGRSKCYPPQDLRQALAELSGLPVKVILGPAEEDLAPLFQEFNPVLSRSMEEALSALSRARAFVGNDSGLTHLAAALGVPTLALFGPTDPALWAPFGGRVRVLCPFEALTPQRLAREMADFFSTTPRWVARKEASLPPKEEPPGVDTPRLAEPWGAGGPESGPPRDFGELTLLGVEVVAVEEAPH